MDHITPRSWQASQSLQSVTRPTVWIQGQHRLEIDHPFTARILQNIEATPDSSMLVPFSTLLIHVSPLANETEDSHDDILHGLDLEAVTPEGADSDMPLIGSGMCELEDMATHPRWSCGEEHAFNRTVSVNNTTLSKSHALTLLFKYSKTTSSTDHLHRVQQQACFMTSQSDALQQHHSDEQDDILLMNNPMASLLSCKNKLFLAIGEILALHMGPKSVDHIPLDILLEDTTKVTYQVYSLISTPLDDDSSDSNNWRTRELLPMKFKVPGSLVQPINPVLATPPSQALFYLFETATLVALTSSLHDRISKPCLKLIPQALQAHRYPYHEASGKCALAIYIIISLT